MLAHGTLAEVGTHAQLLAAGGLYAEQWRIFTGESAAMA